MQKSHSVIICAERAIKYECTASKKSPHPRGMKLFALEFVTIVKELLYEGSKSSVYYCKEFYYCYELLKYCE